MMNDTQKEEKKNQFFFVYGSFRRGEKNADIFKSCFDEAVNAGAKLTYVGKDKVIGTLYDLGDFPGFVSTGYDEIIGDVYELSATKSDVFAKAMPSALAQLDEFEGYTGDDQILDVVAKTGSLYLRKEMLTLGGRCVALYEFNGATTCDPLPQAARIACGDWSAWLKERQNHRPSTGFSAHMRFFFEPQN